MLRTSKYFNRDISWLSFNYRVLEEADDKTLPLYERLKFLAIYSSNLDEFYKVRVAEYKNSAHADDMEGLEGVTPGHLVKEINEIVDKQLQDFGRIFHKEILAGLFHEGLMLYQGEMPKLPEHQVFIRDYFYREVIPYLQPVLLTRGTRTFLRDNRLYLAIRLYRKKRGVLHTKIEARRARYALVKLPTNDLPRFVRLPDADGMCHFLFLDDLVRFNLQELFPGYDVESSYCIKMLRDADLNIKDEFSGNLVDKIRRRRRISA